VEGRVGIERSVFRPPAATLSVRPLHVQVFDRNGRSRGILPMPTGEASSVCFGGAALGTLYVTSGGKLYWRKMKAIGAPAFATPLRLPPWGGG